MRCSTTRDRQWFYVDWWLMNHCSWNCSYCHDIIKSGNIPLPDIRDCFRLVDTLTAYIKTKNQKINFNFTGGEVTEWNEFVNLVEYSKTLHHYIKFRSNGNIDRDTWISIIKNSDEVILEIHPEHTLISKFLLALDLSVKQGLRTNVNINMDKDRWEELDSIYDLIKRKYPTISILKKMLFEDPVKNVVPIDYKPEQVVILKKQTGDLLLEYDNGEQEYTDYQTIVLEGKNKFIDHTCSAGLEQLVIDAWGNIYRGHCRMEGKIGNLGHDIIRWPTSSTICRKEVCVNSFDIHATKLL